MDGRTLAERKAAESERKKKYRAAAKVNRRSVTGRRAKEVNGVLVAVKQEVPRIPSAVPRPRTADTYCCRCDRRTKAAPDYYGRRRCEECCTGKVNGATARQDRPGLAERVDALALMYQTVLLIGERLAKRLKLPTSVSELPWPHEVRHASGESGDGVREDSGEEEEGFAE